MIDLILIGIIIIWLVIITILVAFLHKVTLNQSDLLFLLRDEINQLKFPPREKEITCTSCDSDYAVVDGYTHCPKVNLKKINKKFKYGKKYNAIKKNQK